jgi:hypothetical protein
MIEVSVTLISAVNGQRTQLALMHIANDDKETHLHPRFGTYNVISFRGRGAQLERQVPIKRGRVVHWAREAYHVWNLVRAALTDLGYTDGQKECFVCKNDQKNKEGYK